MWIVGDVHLEIPNHGPVRIVEHGALFHADDYLNDPTAHVDIASMCQPAKEPTMTKPATAPASITELIPLDKIQANPTNVRTHFAAAALEELADSIEALGLLEPIIARKQEDGYGNVRYEIVAGERRWRALHIVRQRNDVAAADLEVPVIVLFGPAATDKRVAMMMLVENLQRVDLDPVEEARGYQLLTVDHGMKQDDVAKAVGRAKATISKRLAILTLPEPVLEKVSAGNFPIADAYKLTQIDPGEARDKLCDTVAKKGRLADWEIQDAITVQQRAFDRAALTLALEARGIKVTDTQWASGDLDKVGRFTADNLHDYKPQQGDRVQRLGNGGSLDTYIDVYRTPAAKNTRAKKGTPHDEWVERDNRLKREHREAVHQVAGVRAEEFQRAVYALTADTLAEMLIEDLTLCPLDEWDANMVPEDLAGHGTAAKKAWVEADPARILAMRYIELGNGTLEFSAWPNEEDGYDAIPMAGTVRERITNQIAEQHPYPPAPDPGPEPWQDAAGNWTDAERPPATAKPAKKSTAKKAAA